MYICVERFNHPGYQEMWVRIEEINTREIFSSTNKRFNRDDDQTRNSKKQWRFSVFFYLSARERERERESFVCICCLFFVRRDWSVFLTVPFHTRPDKRCVYTLPSVYIGCVHESEIVTRE